MSDKDRLIKVFAISLAIAIIITIINVSFKIINAILPTNNNRVINEVYSNDIQNIKIDINSINVKIINGDKFKVSSNGVSKNLKISHDNDKFIIKEKGLNIFKTSLNSEILITIPSKIDVLEVEMDAGSLNISDLTVHEFSLDQGAGKVYINNLVTKDGKLDGGAGELEINDSNISELDLDMGIGKVKFKNTTLGDSKISCGIGDLELDLNNENLYSLKISKGIGNVFVNGESYSDIYYGQGINKIDIDGGIGNIKVTFNN